MAINNKLKIYLGTGGIIAALIGGVGYLYSNKIPVLNYEGLKTRNSSNSKVNWAESKSDSFVEERKVDNKRWWNWSYENRWKGTTPKSNLFKNIDGGFGAYDLNSPLNRACYLVYKKTSPSLQEKEDAWRYCSVPGQSLS
ncbi:hypothetical protein [Candidatus Mycoplasma haematohominis]|uniref:hypothetical protein n=1 Tax=Candidatus Mycoplasma haematohominis TaxID=1494318 RepID=UPI001C0A6BCB|nr:hypothetical protein [Candidatus Mycoplasma haemohominis]